jgi:hypothetical protein
MPPTFIKVEAVAVVLLQRLQVMTLLIDATLFKEVDGAATEGGKTGAEDHPGIE